ncbi:MAG: helix-turn-helix domain-containing protein [Sarcina sp.]
MHKLKIKECRQLKGMTQEILAKKSKISQGYLSSLEKNNQSPTVRILVRIAVNLYVCPCELLNHTCKCKYKNNKD